MAIYGKGDFNISKIKHYLIFCLSLLISILWVFANTPPNISDILLNSTYGTNLTTENLTAYVTYYDNDSDSVTLIYDWRKNGISDAILNMPFDVNGSNENTTNLKDYTTYGNNGSLRNGTWNSSCNAFTSSGGCYEFDGIDDCIHVGNDISLRPTDAITVSAWIKNKNSNNVELVSYRQVPTPLYYILYGLKDDSVAINLNNGSANGRDYINYYNSVLSSNWSFIVLTFSRANQELKAYVNGVLQGSATSTGDYPLFYNHTGLDNLYIG
ncbi:MAG: LamG domain-containing protein, partial [Nanoarchaeota archaeon]|nr:LamG domain-containing protein [Nanoarchaeota archaeon]